VTHVLCNSAVLIAERLKLDLILVPTQTGHTVYHLSRFKPTVPIFACATDPATVNWLCLAWGVTPRTMPELRKEDVALSETDALVNEVVRVAKHHGIARPGQRAVVLGGVPLGKSRHTNYLKVVEIR
jgi:pyruvate kinase